jgi:hypothetical protein
MIADPGNPDDIHKRIEKIKNQLTTFYMCTGVVFLGAIAVTSLAIAYRCSKK